MMEYFPYIIIPRYKILELEQKSKFGIKGFFRVQIKKKDSGIVRWDSGYFPNQILDNGRNQMATRSTWLTDCQVGTDSTPPNASQNALLGFVAGTDSIEETIRGANGVAPYYGYMRRTFRFNLGAALGNLSEVGVGWDKVLGSNLVSRALIIDPVTQEPTSVSLLADEVLDVTYEFRYYAPENDVVGPQVTLNGVVYDTVTRASSVTGERWYNDIGNLIGEYSPYNSSWRAYDGELGTVAQAPNGNAADCDNANHYNLAYLNNSYQRGIGANCGPTGWNLGAGIRSLRIQTTAGSYQTRFGSAVGDNPIPKTADYIMTMRWMLSWEERAV